MVTRHGSPGTNQVTDDDVQRTSAQLEELCAVFIQPEDKTEPLRLVDLADRWRASMPRTAEIHVCRFRHTS